MTSGAIDLVAGLAGRATGERHDYGAGAVVVMTDPEGHEFCVLCSTTQRRPLVTPRSASVLDVKTSS
jgi:Glyoxalase-like domain